jgi:hypothetical protein
MLMAMARELVTEKGIGENADAVLDTCRSAGRKCSDWARRRLGPRRNIHHEQKLLLFFTGS